MDLKWHNLLEEVCIVTESTLERQRAVLHHVLFEHFIPSCGKVARVVRTFVLKLAAMNLHVTRQVILLGERNAAHFTLIRTNAYNHTS